METQKMKKPVNGQASPGTVLPAAPKPDGFRASVDPANYDMEKASMPSKTGSK